MAARLRCRAGAGHVNVVADTGPRVAIAKNEDESGARPLGMRLAMRMFGMSMEGAT